jgi:hypothetical protein
MPEPRQYALVVARWPAGEWVASVVEDETGLRVLHLHHAGCADGSCDVDTTRPGWTVAEAIAFAERKRDEMLAGSLPYWGPPQSVDTFLETTGDGERLEARIGKGPEAGTPSSRAMRAAAGVLGFAGVLSALRSWSPAQWVIALFPVAAVALVALAWMVWNDRDVVRCWRQVLAAGDERQRERATSAARRLRAAGRPSAPRLAA